MEQDTIFENREQFLERIVRYFTFSLLYSKPAQDYVRRMGLDSGIVADIGFNSSQFHHKHGEANDKSAILREGAIKHGFLTPWPERGGYRIFGTKSLILPLYDKEGKINNLYSFHPDRADKEDFLYQETSIYPAFRPNKVELQALFLTDTPHIAAQHQCWIRQHSLWAASYALHGNQQELNQWLEVLKRGLRCKSIYIISRNRESFSDKLASILRLSFADSQISILETLDSKESFLELFEAHDNTEERKDEPVHHFDASNPSSLVFRYNDLRIDVVGGVTSSIGRFKVTLKAYFENRPLKAFRDTVDCYSDSSIQKFIHTASNFLGLHPDEVRSAMSLLIYKLELYRESLRENHLKKAVSVISESDRAEAMEFLSRPDLMVRINDHLGNMLVGEELNRLVVFLVMTSRKLSNPLHLINIGSSGSGKTVILEKISECMPKDEVIDLTAFSQNALYYQHGIKGKALVVQDFGQVESALFPIRELISKKRLSKSVTVRDKQTGKFENMLSIVEGPVSILGSTTSDEIYLDNANRSIIIYSDESAEQNERILEYQRNLYAGLIDVEDQERSCALLQHVQQCLRPLKVIIPYAPLLRLPEAVSTPRRTLPIYMGLIETITFLHQHQREWKTDNNGVQYIESTIEDITWANRLIEHILLAKADTLTGPCRTFFEAVKRWLSNQNRESFSQNDIIKAFRLHPSSVKRHVKELNEKCYVNIASGNRYKSGYTYTITDYSDFNILKNRVSDALGHALQNMIQKNQQSLSGSGVVHA